MRTDALPHLGHHGGTRDHGGGRALGRARSHVSGPAAIRVRSLRSRPRSGGGLFQLRRRGVDLRHLRHILPLNAPEPEHQQVQNNTDDGQPEPIMYYSDERIQQSIVEMAKEAARPKKIRKQRTLRPARRI